MASTTTCTSSTCARADFGTKDVLFSTVIKRRAAYMAHERILALDAARARVQGKALPVEDLVSGYVWPFVERSVAGGKGWKNYSLFVARHANSPEFSKVLSEHYDPVARQYLNEFERTFPGMPQKDLYYAFSFMVGAMVATVAEPGRVEHLSFGQIKASDVGRGLQAHAPFPLRRIQVARSAAFIASRSQCENSQGEVPLMFSDHVLGHCRGKLDHQPHQRAVSVVTHLVPDATQGRPIHQTRRADGLIRKGRITRGLHAGFVIEPHEEPRRER
jgi:hypothetical protein